MWSVRKALTFEYIVAGFPVHGFCEVTDPEAFLAWPFFKAAMSVLHFFAQTALSPLQRRSSFMAS